MLPTNEVGEVAIRSETTMLGYLNRPDSTRDVMRKDGWLLTGDLGRVDPRGYLFLVDRKKFMIITGGYNVYPVVVENALADHPSVSEVCVVGVPDERWGEMVCAVVVPSGDPPSEEELIAFARERVGKFETPKRVVFVEDLPRGPTGKLKKAAVRDWFGP